MTPVFNGKVYEALTAARSHRERRDLHHAALVVSLGIRHGIATVAMASTVVRWAM